MDGSIFGWWDAYREYAYFVVIGVFVAAAIIAVVRCRCKATIAMVAGSVIWLGAALFDEFAFRFVSMNSENATIGMAVAERMNDIRLAGGLVLAIGLLGAVHRLRPDETNTLIDCKPNEDLR